MIEFHHYARIKDNYCICYFGHSDEYLVQLKLLKPIIERELPGLKIHFGCKDDKASLLGECDGLLKISEFKARRSDFAHMKELKFNGQMHPVEELLVDAGIKNWAVAGEPQKDHANRCVIITQGSHPTKPLEARQIETLKRMHKEKGYEVEIDTDTGTAGLVVGVESFGLFEAAGRGIQTKLVATGVGTRLYKGLFPFGEVLHI